MEIKWYNITYSYKLKSGEEFEDAKLYGTDNLNESDYLFYIESEIRGVYGDELDTFTIIDVIYEF